MVDILPGRRSLRSQPPNRTHISAKRQRQLVGRRWHAACTRSRSETGVRSEIRQCEEADDSQTSEKCLLLMQHAYLSAHLREHYKKCYLLWCEQTQPDAIALVRSRWLRLPLLSVIRWFAVAIGRPGIFSIFVYADCVEHLPRIRIRCSFRSRFVCSQLPHDSPPFCK